VGRASWGTVANYSRAVRGDGMGRRTRRVIVAITAVRGARYATRLLEALRGRGVETHLVVSEDARADVEMEAIADGTTVADLADHIHQPSNQAARISSGSFLVDGMVVAPCTAAAAGGISSGTGPNLIHRAADVTIKEGRPLALLVVEDGLSPIALESLERLNAIPGVSVVWPLVTAADTGATEDGDVLDPTVQLLMRKVGIEREG
jgi:4-hydroxy-3-polyprenylbenzoate decarboxylase